MNGFQKIHIMKFKVNSTLFDKGVQHECTIDGHFYYCDHSCDNYKI